MVNKKTLAGLVGGFALGVLANSCAIEENYHNVVLPITEDIFLVESVRENSRYFNLFGKKIFSWSSSFSIGEPEITYSPSINPDEQKGSTKKELYGFDI